MAGCVALPMAWLTSADNPGGQYLKRVTIYEINTKYYGEICQAIENAANLLRDRIDIRFQSPTAADLSDADIKRAQRSR